MTTQMLSPRQCAPGSTVTNPLSRRENEVLRAIADVHTVAWIAAKAPMSTGTVGKILSRVRDKLAADTTAHAVHLAHQKGILS